jgi:hypothetical protein
MPAKGQTEATEDVRSSGLAVGAGFGSDKCPDCKGDGWIKAEWDECALCYGSGHVQTDAWRANMRVMRAEENLRNCECELARVRRTLMAAAAELVAARSDLPNSPS